MEYPDFPFAEDKKSFVRHYDILEYINNYAEEFAVKDHIKFNSKVSNITPVGDGDEIKWKVTAVDDSTVSEDAYDSVVICNGYVFNLKAQIRNETITKQTQPFRPKTIINLRPFELHL